MTGRNSGHLADAVPSEYQKQRGDGDEGDEADVRHRHLERSPRFRLVVHCHRSHDSQVIEQADGGIKPAHRKHDD